MDGMTRNENVLTAARMLVRLGWRNVWRNRRRSLVVISSIAFGIFAMILSMGIMNGMNSQMIENTINTSLGHVAIHRKGFHDEMKLARNFTPSGKILGALGSERTIVAFAPRVKTEGIVKSSQASQQVIVVGIDPVMEKKASHLYGYTLTDGGGRFLLPGDTDTVMISKYLAEKLELLEGDKVVLLLQDRTRTIQGVGLRITGFYQTPIDSFDKFVVFTPLKKLQKITGLGENISEITVRLARSRDVDAVKSRLAGAIADPSLEILTWKEMAPNLVRAVKLFDQMMYIFFAIVFITVPIFAPVVVALGFDPVWFGVLFVMNMQIYFLSPPFGPAAFWLKSVAPEDVTLQEIFIGVMPFIALQTLGMFMVLFFPDIAMWLPRMMGSGG